MTETVLVSACLLGIRCRYDGRDKKNHTLTAQLKEVITVPVCPEQLGGLPTPRPRAQIVDGDGFDVLAGRALVRNEAGEDVTPNFIRGAEETLNIARLTTAKKAYLKEKSPSCGASVIKQNNRETAGVGVAAAMLKNEGIEVSGISS